MHAMKGMTLDSLNRKHDPAQERMKQNFDLLLLKMNNFTGADRDKVRSLCSKMFPKTRAGSDSTFPVDDFLSIINTKFVINLSKSDLSELMSAMGMDFSNGVHPYQFFLGVKNTEKLSKPYWTAVREEQMENEHDMIKKYRPASFERAFSAAQRSDQSSASNIRNVNEFQEVIKEHVEQFITKDIDRYRQVLKRLDMKNKAKGITRSELKKIMFSKFTISLNDADIDRLFKDYQTTDGKIDFRNFLGSTLGDTANGNMVLSFASGEDTLEKRKIKQAQKSHFQKQDQLITVWTVKDVKKILNMKISELASRENDQFRQIFKKLSNKNLISKQDFFVALKQKFQMNLRDELVEEVFNIIDSNQDGYMDLTEFVAFLRDENRGATAFQSSVPMTPVPEVGPDPVFGQAWAQRQASAQHKTSRNKLRKRGSGAGTSMARLMTGDYNPAHSGRRLHTSSGPRLVCTPPKTAEQLLARYQGEWANGSNNNRNPTPQGAQVEVMRVGEEEDDGVGIGWGSDLRSTSAVEVVKPTSSAAKREGRAFSDFVEESAGPFQPPKRPSPPSRNGVAKRPEGMYSRQSPRGKQVGGVVSRGQNPSLLPHLAMATGEFPEPPSRCSTAPMSGDMVELMDMLAVSPRASPLTSEAKKAPTTSRPPRIPAAQTKKLRTKLQGTGKLKPIGGGNGPAPPQVLLKPSRPKMKSSSRQLKDLSKVSSAKFFHRSPNIAAKLSLGLSGANTPFTPKTSFIQTQEMDSVMC
mmetsp:Transcript_1512/g.2070  ORF Transcript_1512/g.2070 Transcript_1512/m.2070 type:complete len:751 (-) Transcript_1512:379-2631(-)